ncbi:MAG: glycosyl hydrolase [Paludibacter sp.]
MKKSASLILLLVLTHFCFAQKFTNVDFQNPTSEFRPWIFWDWMNDMVTKKGITSDLEQFKKFGVSGTLIMLVGGHDNTMKMGQDHHMPNPIKCMSPEFFDAWKFAAEESHRLGLTVTSQCGPGWCHSGGPWIKPAQAVQRVVFSEVKITGNSKRTEIILRQTPDTTKILNQYTLDLPGFENFTNEIAVVAFPDKSIVNSSDIIELTKKVENARIKWIVPKGNWIIRRYAMRNALAYNRPAPDGGKGFECDKLDKAAVDSIFEGMVGRFLKNSPELAGNTIRGMEADSWEVGNPEWSPKFREEFIKRRGYDPIPWLITYKTNQIVENKDMTDRFKNDVYLTQTDLFADNFFTHITQKCHEKGMIFMTEPYYGPFDPVRCGGRTDMPMGEVWASGDCMNSARWAGSAGHTYGRKTVGAEMFTGRWCDGNWTMDPYGLKRIGDLAFCNGINMFVLHGTALQPWGLDVKPGMPMHFWGTMFCPGQTWWEQGKAFTDYISRCQYLLRQGKNVADVAVLMPTVNWKESTPEGLHQLYNYDHITEEILLNDMDWKNGYFTLSSGTRYRVLLLPKTNGRISSQIAKKLLDLVEKGGTVICQDKPIQSTGLTNYPQSNEEVKNIVSRLWGSIDSTNTENKVGKGRMVWMKTYSVTNDPETEWLLKDRPTGKAFYNKPAQTNRWNEEFLNYLKNMQLFPDVEVLKASGTAMVWGGKDETACGLREGNDAISWIHREAGDSDIYFVASSVSNEMKTELLFRITDKIPVLWFPEIGKTMSYQNWKQRNGRISIDLALAPYESVFVVFVPKSSKQEGLTEYKQSSVNQTISTDKTWNVHFAKNWGAPDSAMLKIGSWSENTDNGIRYYSGTAKYETSIKIDKKLLVKNRIWLNLGEVKNIAEIFINNQNVGLHNGRNRKTKSCNHSRRIIFYRHIHKFVQFRKINDFIKFRLHKLM